MVSKPTPGGLPGQAYVGRFAPSPTGDLHFGSLVAAVGSFLQARSHDGQWLVRIEDIDPPREVPDSAEGILAELARFGMHSDLPVLYQSTRGADHQRALELLLERELAFPCGCSRTDLPRGRPYPGTCRAGLPAGRVPRSVRVRIANDPVTIQDQLAGSFREDLAATCGDFVIRRADGLIAYQLAVVVDDAWQGVTEVVRGADLLDSTPRQVYLQGLLGLPTPAYLHLPVVTGADGAKLSKRLRSDPLAGRSAPACLRQALHFLGQPAPPASNLEELWEWAIEHWNPHTIPRPAAMPANSGTSAEALY